MRSRNGLKWTGEVEIQHFARMLRKSRMAFTLDASQKEGGRVT